MDAGFEVPRRTDNIYPPPWQLGAFAMYTTAHFDNGQPPPETPPDDAGGEQGQDTEPADTGETAPTPEEITGSEPPSSPAEPLVDVKNFDGIFVYYRDPIYSFILHMVGNVESAQDLEQDTFLRAYVALSKPVPVYESGLKAWLYRIAYNVSVDYLRRGSLIGFEPLPPSEVAETGGPGAAILRSKEAPFDEQLANMDIMRETLRRLKPVESAIILLDAIFGLKQDEIATIVNVRPSGMHMRMSRAHAKARKIAADLAKFKGE